ncbi:MAG: hypothetical protein JWN45_3077 [Acidobacteriaceae bacterium]|nr:hypothetical protein [Acidobacteriaceae bacterium]
MQAENLPLRFYGAGALIATCFCSNLLWTQAGLNAFAEIFRRGSRAERQDSFSGVVSAVSGFGESVCSFGCRGPWTAGGACLASCSTRLFRQ